MRKPNFASLPTAVLNGYLNDIQAELAEREKVAVKKGKVMAKVKALAKAEGISVDELLGGESQPKARRSTAGRTVAPKYRNPANAKETWTGRGRKPKWVEAFLAKKGAKIEQLLIK